MEIPFHVTPEIDAVPRHPTLTTSRLPVVSETDARVRLDPLVDELACPLAVGVIATCRQAYCGRSFSTRFARFGTTSASVRTTWAVAATVPGLYFGPRVCRAMGR